MDDVTLHLEQDVVFQVYVKYWIASKDFYVLTRKGKSLQCNQVFCVQTILPAVCDQSEPTNYHTLV